MMWGWGWGAWLMMSVMTVLFWSLIIAGVVALVRYVGGGHAAGHPGTGSGQADAEHVLAERFARGEIDEDEYKRRSDLLRTGR
ncbi:MULTISPECIES: SHOCT domain-containing protein [unclassified Frankia]|uniref:SHOCT domain-containing protein n=1 Tax=unclassified Frankia TaxID=2632575 RepID=UPI002AD226DA|nr:MULTISPECIES: SHOCT domain-containing protein [unclassified Frankia]